MVVLECIVNSKEPLRMPGVYRASLVCNNIDIVIELPEEVYSINKDEKITLVFTKDKEECLENDFCGNGYIVSTKKIGDKIRTVLSIGGLLLIMNYSEKEKPLERTDPIEKYYIGLKRLT